MGFHFSLPSFAKINWMLRILGKRDDGFHELCTVFQTVSLRDKIRFSSSREIDLRCNNFRLPTDERNLIVKAAMALRRKFNVRDGAFMRLEKRIPSPGGLGGGSSNAAVTLIGLDRLWNLNASIEELHSVAAEIGSDIPFFPKSTSAIRCFFISLEFPILAFVVSYF